MIPSTPGVFRGFIWWTTWKIHHLKVTIQPFIITSCNILREREIACDGGNIQVLLELLQNLVLQNNLLVLRADSIFIRDFPYKIRSFFISRYNLKRFTFLSPNWVQFWCTRWSQYSSCLNQNFEFCPVVPHTASKVNYP